MSKDEEVPLEYYMDVDGIHPVKTFMIDIYPHQAKDGTCTIHARIAHAWTVYIRTMIYVIVNAPQAGLYGV